MMRRNMFVLVLLCIIALSFTGCGKDAPHSDADTGSSSTQSAATTSNDDTADGSSTQSAATSSNDVASNSSATKSANESKKVNTSSNKSTNKSSIKNSVSSTVVASKTSSVFSDPATTDLEDDKMRDYPDYYKLIVNGKNFGDVKVNPEYGYLELPLLAIMKELGAEVEWLDEAIVKLTFDNNNYYFDTENGILKKNDWPGNILYEYCGGGHPPYYKVVDDEVIVDNRSANWLIINEMRATLSWDKGVLTISK